MQSHSAEVLFSELPEVDVLHLPKSSYVLDSNTSKTLFYHMDPLLTILRDCSP